MNASKRHTNHGKEKRTMDQNEWFEEILNETGGFGKFQIMLLFLSLIASMTCSMNHLGAIYLGYSPDFQCVNGVSTGSGTPLISASSTSPASTETNFTSTCPNDTLSSCSEVVFDTSVMERTVVTEFLLICNRLPLLPTMSSSYMAGVMVINLISGFISDRIGRRKIFLFLSLLHIISSFLTAFSSSSYLFFVIARFFVGGAIHSTWTAIFVITTEVTVEDKRGLTGGVLNAGWSIGNIFMSGFAFWLRDWSKLQLVFACFSLLLFTFYFLIPESPRWLLQQGRTEEAFEVIMRIAKFNGAKAVQEEGFLREHFEALKAAPPAAVLAFDEDLPESEKANVDRKAKSENRNGMQASLLIAKKMLSYAKFRWHLLFSMIPWFVVGMASYGMAFSIKLIDFNIFLLSIMSSCIGMTCIFVIIPMYDKFYRTIVLTTIFALTGLAGLAFILVPLDDATSRTALYLTFEAFSSSSFFLVDTFTHEVFSTDTRNFAFAFLDSVSKLGTVTAPFVVDLGGIVSPSIPPVVFGASMLVASAVFFFLPETKDKPLAQFIEDLATDRSCFELKILKKPDPLKVQIETRQS